MALPCKTLILAVLFVLTMGCFGDDLQDYVLRVGCRVGHPPYSDWDPVTKTCVGMIAEYFFKVCDRIPLDCFNVSPQYTDEVADVQVDENGTSVYDVSISITAVTPERLLAVDFSMPVIETDYVAVLRPHFTRKQESLVQSLTRRSVFYVFAVVMLVIITTASLFIALESFYPNSKMMSLSVPHRMIYSIQSCMSVDGDYMNPASRLLRALLYIVYQICLLNIFGAVITSQMTSSQLQSRNLSIERGDLRGLKLLHQSITLRSFLPSARIGAHETYVETLQDALPLWFAEQGPYASYDGFVATSEESKVFLRKFSPRLYSSYAVTDPFTTNGLLESRALAMSRSMNPLVSSRINLALRIFREDGTLYSLKQKNIMMDQATSETNDIPLEDQDVMIVTVLVSVLYSLYFGLAILLFLKQFFDQHETLTSLGDMTNKSMKLDGVSVLKQDSREFGDGTNSGQSQDLNKSNGNPLIQFESSEFGGVSEGLKALDPLDPEISRVAVTIWITDIEGRSKLESFTVPVPLFSALHKFKEECTNLRPMDVSLIH